MAEYESLSAIDAATIQEAILKLVATWDDLPFTGNASTVQWGNVGTSTCIGLFALQGAVYKTRYISGSYVGLFPFRIVYQCSPTSNKTRIDSEQVINELADYLKGYTGVLSEDSHINVQSFSKTSLCYKLEADEAGNEQYTCTMQVEYFYK